MYLGHWQYYRDSLFFLELVKTSFFSLPIHHVMCVEATYEDAILLYRLLAG